MTAFCSEVELIELFRIAHSHHNLLKFTYDISKTETVFLDTVIFKGQRFKRSGIFDIRSYTKPSNTHQYLHRTSYHNPAVFKGFIKGETIRHIRNNNNEQTLEKILDQFKTHLLQRGYKIQEIQKHMNSALNRSRNDLLTHNKDSGKNKIPLVLVTKYHNSIGKLGFYLRKHWHKLKRDEKCRKIFTENPITSYCRHKHLGDYIINSKI